MTTKEFNLNTIIKIENGIDYIREIPYETAAVGFYDSNNVFVKLATYDSRDGDDDAKIIEILKGMQPTSHPNETIENVKLGDDDHNVYGQKLDDVREINRLNEEIKKLKGIIGDLYIERCNLYETIEEMCKR